ncbi:hypothetical protein D3C86_1755000 [compost metagenome]
MKAPSVIESMVYGDRGGRAFVDKARIALAIAGRYGNVEKQRAVAEAPIERAFLAQQLQFRRERGLRGKLPLENRRQKLRVAVNEIAKAPLVFPGGVQSVAQGVADGAGGVDGGTAKVVAARAQLEPRHRLG